MVQAVVQTTVTGLQGNPISATAPTANQSLTWSGSAWAGAGPFLPLAGGTVTGNLTLNGTTTIPTAVLGTTTISNGLTVTGPGAGTSVNIPAGNVTMSGNLTVSATAVIGGNLNANAARFTSGIFMNTVGNTSLVPSGTGWAMFTQGQNYTLGLQESTDPAYALNQGSTSLCLIYSTGNMTLRGSLTQGSDATTKTNINPISQGISLVRQLLPKSFQWIAPATPMQGTPAPSIQWGFIAQDVEGVIPEAVTSTPSMEAGGPALLGLDINGIVAVLTNAIKQLDERCTALESHDGITPPAAQLA